MTVRSARLIRTPVFDRSQPLTMAIRCLDMDRLRRAFAELVDAAAEALHREGLDQDDAVLDRQLLLRVAAPVPSTHWLTAVPLSDATRLRNLILSAIADEHGAEPDADQVEVAAIRVVAIAERCEG